MDSVPVIFIKSTLQSLGQQSCSHLSSLKHRVWSKTASGLAQQHAKCRTFRVFIRTEGADVFCKFVQLGGYLKPLQFNFAEFERLPWKIPDIEFINVNCDTYELLDQRADYRSGEERRRMSREAFENRCVPVIMSRLRSGARLECFDANFVAQEILLLKLLTRTDFSDLTIAYNGQPSVDFVLRQLDENNTLKAFRLHGEWPETELILQNPKFYEQKRLYLHSTWLDSYFIQTFALRASDRMKERKKGEQQYLFVCGEFDYELYAKLVLAVGAKVAGLRLDERVSSNRLRTQSEIALCVGNNEAVFLYRPLQ